jgi:GNAT superfamily N-acetyltransferase
MSDLGTIQRIDKVTDLATMLRFFIPPWHSVITKDYNHGRLIGVIAYGPDMNGNVVAKSGCVVKTHDGIGILYYLCTNDAYVNHGLATAVVKQAADWTRPNVILARYRKDELHIAKLFSNAGYRIIHEGTDDFIIVAF